MAVYRLWPSVNGPATATAYSGNFVSGVVFTVSQGGCWFEGYWVWVCGSGQSTAPVKCALWSVTGAATGVLVPGSVVTSGTLTAGAWNYVALAEPVQLAPGFDPVLSTSGSAYIAAVGINGAFPDTGGFWTAPVANGPLNAYAGAGHAGSAPWSLPQGVFTVSGSDPSAVMPAGASSIDNFWVDVQVGTVAPAGYAGSYRLWPGKQDANPLTSADSAANYVIATEVRLSRTCALNRVWYYSPPGTVQLATRAGVYLIGSAGTGTEAAAIASPSWSGAAGSGWISASFALGTVLPAGHYKVYVYNSAASPDQWSAKDANTAYWGTGAGSGGISWGPLSAPRLADASAAYIYDSNGSGNSPPYSNGSGSTEAGQNTFAVTGPRYPYLYVDGLAQNYWVDLEVTPAAAPGLLAAAGVV